MEKIYTDRWTGLDPDQSRADSFTVEGRTSQLEFDSANNRGNSSPKTILANSGNGNKQPVRRIWKKWTQKKKKDSKGMLLQEQTKN